MIRAAFPAGPPAGSAACPIAGTVLLCAALIVLQGCATVIRVPPEGRAVDPLPAETLALTRPGPAAFSVESGEISGVSGCRLLYEVYTPAEPRTAVLVVLAHGFSRSLANMRGWAVLWASQGVRTAVLSFCASTPFAGHHETNAADLRRLAAVKTDGPVIYAGFSSGGLSALLAASDDPRAAGCLALDPADAGSLAAGAAGRFRVPGLFILAEPSSCNAGNNIIPALSGRAGIEVVRVRNARHCHFEDPYDPGCEAVCGSVLPPEVAQDIALTIRAEATAWLLVRCGILQPGDVPDPVATRERSPWSQRLQVLQAP